MDIGENDIVLVELEQRCVSAICFDLTADSVESGIVECGLGSHCIDVYSVHFLRTHLCRKYSQQCRATSHIKHGVSPDCI